ncbi:hypothetical protein PO909_004072 [Leuciscus waleckii]
MTKLKNKKRNIEENEDDQLPIFDKDGGKDGHLDDGDDDQADLSDSEESVFSGLEESGSDSDDEDEEEEEDGDEEKSSDVGEDKAASGDGDDRLSAKDVTKPQSSGQNSKEKKRKKKKKAAGKEGGEERVVSDRDSGLKVSSQVDEYEHDTSDEEVTIALFSTEIVAATVI